MQVFRIDDAGDTYLPHRNRAGRFVLGDPRLGSERHHAKNRVYADTLEEVVRLIEGHGHSLWMKGHASKQTNLISPGNIQIVR